MKYNCVCGKSFGNRKSDYERHVNKAIPCDAVKAKREAEEKKEKEKLVDLVLTNESQEDIIERLRMQMHNLMWRHGTKAIDAFADIMKILFIRFLQPYLKTSLKCLTDPKTYKDYDTNSEFIDENIHLVEWSKLLESFKDDDSIKSSLEKLWDIFHSHEKTCQMFPSGKIFHSKLTVIAQCMRLINKSKIGEFDDMPADVKGQIYEKFVNGYMSQQGKDKGFGQFFTPRAMIDRIMEMNTATGMNYDDVKSIYDPCMGTGGFLMSMVHELSERKYEVYGRELESNTFITALMNVLLTTGNVDGLTCGDSFIDDSDKKYDFIGTNPPFGVKVQYDEIIRNGMHIPKEYEIIKGGKPVKVKLTPAKLKDRTGRKIPAKVAEEYRLIDAAFPVNMKLRNIYTLYENYEIGRGKNKKTVQRPITINDGSSLFLMHCMHKLAPNGLCNIVLPNGSLANNTSQKGYKLLRKKLVEEFALYQVTFCPGGVFEHAGVSTMVLTFRALGTKVRPNDNIGFYQSNVDCSRVEPLGHVTRQQLRDNDYVLNWSYYRPVEEMKIENVEMKKLGDLVTPVKGKRHNVSSGKESGKYPLVCSSKLGKVKWMDTYEYEGPVLVVGTGGGANVGIYEKCNVSTHCSVFTSNHLKYIQYFLMCNLDKIDELFVGNTLKNLSIDRFLNIQIPVPSKEVQQRIVDQCDTIMKSKKMAEQQIELLREMGRNYIQSKLYPTFHEFEGEEKKLGDVIEKPVSGSFNTKDMDNKGDIPFYSAGNYNPVGFHSNHCFNCKEYIIFIKDGNTSNMSRSRGLGKSYLVYGKASGNSHTLQIKPKQLVNCKFIYYLMDFDQPKFQKYTDNGSSVGLGNIRMTDLMNHPMRIPSKETQEQIVSQMDMITNQIDMIKQNISQAENLLKKCFE